MATSPIFGEYFRMFSKKSRKSLIDASFMFSRNLKILSILVISKYQKTERYSCPVRRKKRMKSVLACKRIFYKSAII